MSAQDFRDLDDPRLAYDAGYDAGRADALYQRSWRARVARLYAWAKGMCG